jgi:hypothetical protein
VTAAAVAVNVAVLASGATDTDGGTVRAAGALLETATLMPPPGAGLDSVTVHGVTEDAARLIFVHCSDVTVGGVTAGGATVGGATSERLAVVPTPFRVAVTVAC